ncbi:hypothetical protein LXL04_005754 [Taraxacum kok-saghyz]
MPQPTSRTGLDDPTIESYPKIILGESFRLPNDDGTCAICLSDYKTKESLRTIPECHHYFHSECIDEWLKLNVTCPVCRKAPENSTVLTTITGKAATTIKRSYRRDSNHMETENILLLIFCLYLLKPIAGANDDCLPTSCGPDEPEVRFPFRILGRQPAKCGFSGFDLSCDEHNKTTIQLPSSLSYIVNRISYVSQVIYIDPQFCLPNRIVGVNLTDTPFRFSTLWSYTFYNCSSQNFSFTYRSTDVPFPCRSSGNYSVIATRTGFLYSGYMPSNCKVMKTILAPVRSDGDIREDVELMWFTPFCRSCEMEGKACRLKSDDGLTVCGSSRGISKTVKYGLSIGIGVPALVCIIGLVCCASSKVQGHTNNHNHNINLSSVAVDSEPAARTGLDGPTIESYVKTMLGESCRLPDDYSTCVICLSDYKPKESLRTIPKCNHYFHSECIDEWLTMNETCPVCRNTPESSASVSPCSSASTGSSSVDSL